MLENTPRLPPRERTEALKQAHKEKLTIKPGSLVRVGSSEWTHPDMPYQIRRYLFATPDEESGATKWWVGPVSMSPKDVDAAAREYAEGGPFEAKYPDCYAVDMLRVTKILDS